MKYFIKIGNAVKVTLVLSFLSCQYEYPMLRNKDNFDQKENRQAVCKSLTIQHAKEVVDLSESKIDDDEWNNHFVPIMKKKDDIIHLNLNNNEIRDPLKKWTLPQSVTKFELAYNEVSLATIKKLQGRKFELLDLSGTPAVCYNIHYLKKIGVKKN